MKKIITTHISRMPIERETNTISDKIISTSAFWTLNNGLEVQVHYYKAIGMYGSYKSVSISPFVGHYKMPYCEIRDGLEHVMNAVQAWASRRPDRTEWNIHYKL